MDEQKEGTQNVFEFFGKSTGRIYSETDLKKYLTKLQSTNHSLTHYGVRDASDKYEYFQAIETRFH